MRAKIQTKLLAGFGIGLLILIAIAVFMLAKFSEANAQLSVMVDSSSKKMEISYKILENVLETGIREKDQYIRAAWREGIVSDAVVANRFVETGELTEELDELVDAQGQDILRRFRKEWQDYKAALLRLREIEDKENYNEAIGYLDSVDQARNEAVNQLELLIRKNRRDMLEEKKESAESYDASVTSIIILVGFGLLVSLLFSVWIITSINNRIRSISLQARRIASREYTDEMLEQTENDEMNPIVNSLININDSFREVTKNADRIASGDYTKKMKPRSKRDVLGISLKQMAISLESSLQERERHNWLTTGLNRLNERLMGNQESQELTENVISFLTEYLEAQLGAIYLMDEDQQFLELSGHYGFPTTDKLQERFRLKEGLVGQAAYDRKEILIDRVPREQLRISSTVLDAGPLQLLIVPFTFEGRILGVVELGKLTALHEKEREFLNAAIEYIALAVHSAIARKKIQELLHETQIQSEELQTQQEELRQMNEELEEQTQNLKQQQEELQQTNEELEEQTQALEVKNKEIEAAKYDVEQKTKQLEITSKYKSEFLANMSHELRTPLNSLLILSKDLAENKKKNLDEDQIESSEIIYKSGHDLLLLINEVLDLSRVEAGKMSLNVEKVRLADFFEDLFKLFRYQAAQKTLELRSEMAADLPEYIQTDPHRLNQILKNLLSNAIKFTDQGHVSLGVERKGKSNLVIRVQDTGIGIKPDKQMTIFEAFQQAEGGTARRYGGTGLGLSISRELVKLLGGEIQLESTYGKGSVFSVVLPVKIIAPAKKTVEKIPEKPAVPNHKDFLNYPSIKDDRSEIQKRDKVVLIIEDDLQFARILKKQANQKGFKTIVASTGEDGLAYAKTYLPHAIILDIELPGIDGHQVLNQIKINPELRHIPVHMVSVDERTLDPIKQGAVEYLMKPIAKQDLDRAFQRIQDFVNRKMKNLLIIEDDPNSRTAIRKLIGNGDVKCLEAGSGEEALEKIDSGTIDCIVLDMGLPDMSGFDLIRKLEEKREHVPPIIIYTGKELTKEENEELEKYADSIIIKGVKSEERLLDETALFLHRTINNLPDQKKQIINSLYDKDLIFSGKKILVVDDDMRNVFALSKVLKERGMEIVKADNGKAAINALHETPDFDLVLMDIMMPEMDGYEAMRKIREEGRFRDLPIIALTAKAMRDDKQKCIDAGANDYISKPVDVPRLLSLMQVWLSR